MGNLIDIALLTGLVKDLRGSETFAPAQVDTRNIRLTLAGNTVKRPGHLEKWDTGEEYPVIALIPENNGYAYTENGKLFSLGTSVTEIHSGGSSSSLIPQYVMDKGKIVLANGSSPLLIEGDTVNSLGGSPPNGRFIAKISDYTILSGYHDTEYSWSGANNIESWPSDHTANIQPTGTLLNMVEHKGKLLFFKENEGEVWNFVGGSDPFIRYASGKIAQGLGAQYSVVKANDDRVYWFGNEGDFYVYEGGSPHILSKRMRSRLDDMNNVSDMRAFDIRKENVVMWINPADGLTLLYDYSTNQWFEDNAWGIGWQSLPFRSYMELNRKQYFGSRKYDGLVHEWSEDYKDDDGQAIRIFRSFKVKLSRGDNRVRMDSLLLRREGSMATSSVIAPVMQIRYRWDSGTWSNWRQETIGSVGKHDPYAVRLSNLGMGRDFEVEIQHSDATDFVMTNAIASFTEMLR